MIKTISLKEYDQLKIREKIDVKNKCITSEYANMLQKIIIDGKPIFSWGYKSLTAQHWVGTISLKDLNIEILPKLYGSVYEDELRSVLVRMVLFSKHPPSVRDLSVNAQLSKNSLLEIIIDTFLNLLERYLKEGILHSYSKFSLNLNGVKGRIIYNKHFTKNIFKPSKFWCKFSKFTPDNSLNSFLKLCLVEMNKISTDQKNKIKIRHLLPSFEATNKMEKQKAVNIKLSFNSTNSRARDVYTYGKLFLSNIFCSLSSGNTPINMMLFDMNKLYETFVYRVTKSIYGNNVVFQMRGNFLIERNSDSKKFMSLRPDIVIKRSNGKFDIIDTKWKIPKNFAKESDVYQMNAYSSGIPNVARTIILYPQVDSNSLSGEYTFLGSNRVLLIRSIDLMECLNWKKFINTVSMLLS